MSYLGRDQVSNLGEVSGALTIPSRRVVVEREFLAWRFNHQFEFNRSFVSDVVLNLFGFIPFGMALSGLLHGRRLPRLPRLQRVYVVVIAAAFVSLLIDYVQTWPPSRSSSSLDLLLNIAGGGLGVVAWTLFLRYDLQTKKAGQPEG
ncbi:MAG: glycopeptide antibiotics resistance protein [Verrucomicrobiales bacterium]|jgi:glycopeptide antibiotics resistance protein